SSYQLVPPGTSTVPLASCTWSVQNRSPSLPWLGSVASLPVTPGMRYCAWSLAPASDGDGVDQLGLEPERSSTRLWLFAAASPASSTVLNLMFSVPSRLFQYRIFPLASTTDAAAAGLQIWVPSLAETHLGPGGSNGAPKLPPTDGAIAAERAGTPLPHAVSAATTATTGINLRAATPIRAAPPRQRLLKALIPSKGAADDHPVAIRRPGGHIG